VTETKWVEDEQKPSKLIGRNQLYAASQKNIDTAESQVHNTVGIGLQVNSYKEAMKIYEQPVDVNNLASYFDKMQVGKKAANARSAVKPNPGPSTLANNDIKPSSRQKQQAERGVQPTRPSRDS